MKYTNSRKEDEVMVNNEHVDLSNEEIEVEIGGPKGVVP